MSEFPTSLPDIRTESAVTDVGDLGTVLVSCAKEACDKW